MKKFYILIIFFIFSIDLIGQSNLQCGTISSSGNKDFSSYYSTNSNENSSICINIFFHIVRKSNGIGGYNSSDISLIVDNLNSVYNNYNIYIDNFGFDYVDNTTFYDIDNNLEFENLIQVNNQASAINFYLVNNAPFAGKAEDILSKDLVVVNSYALLSSSPHELGHCLNL